MATPTGNEDREATAAHPPQYDYSQAQPVYGSGPPPPRKHRVRRVVLLCLAGVVGFIVVISVVSAALSGPAHKAAAPQQSTSAPSQAAATTAPAAAPSPDGTFTGSCNYTLGDSPSTGTAMATGDINVENTGNVGIVTKVTITWPQEGFSPLSLTKTVRVPYGGSLDVQFHRPLTGTQVDNLQNYQLGHAGDDGCTYNGSMVGTFGAAH
jgi:hypothetical protein